MAFETYLVVLVIYASWLRSRGTGDWFWGMMGILLRTSIIWFIMILFCIVWALTAWEVYAVRVQFGL
jgi:hypothetical protein